VLKKLLRRAESLDRHLRAPYLKEREQFLDELAKSGLAKKTLMVKAEELYWVASKLSEYKNLHLSLQQIRIAAKNCDWRERDRISGRAINRVAAYKEFVSCARQWLRYLGCLVQPSIVFQTQLDDYCRWAREERGLAETTVACRQYTLKQFLQWIARRRRSLTAVCIGDIDQYLAFSGEHGWSRRSIGTEVDTLRAFFRFAATKRWCKSTLADAIYGPRVFTLETLPAGPSWTDVERLLSGIDSDSDRGIRDRAILMLFAIYGLRADEVTRLRLEDIDWDHDVLSVQRSKRGGVQIFPLLPSVGNAIIEYLKKVRPKDSARREIFLGLRAPYGPVSGTSLYRLTSDRLNAIGVHTAHHGPHSLRHANATRLLSERLSLKEIGDHLGHRATSSTRIYAKVDLPGLREVASYDLGDLI
jgi:integrase/recombinase XerD